MNQSIPYWLIDYHYILGEAVVAVGVNVGHVVGAVIFAAASALVISYNEHVKETALVVTTSLTVRNACNKPEIITSIFH